MSGMCFFSLYINSVCLFLLFEVGGRREVFDGGVQKSGEMEMMRGRDGWMNEERKKGLTGNVP